jgi:hypothetical protein
MSSPVVPIAIAVLVIVLAIVFIVRLRQGKIGEVPDYQMLFFIGVAFIPISIGTGNNVFFILAIVFMIIGITHKDEWKKGKKGEVKKKGVKKIKMGKKVSIKDKGKRVKKVSKKRG